MRPIVLLYKNKLKVYTYTDLKIIKARVVTDNNLLGFVVFDSVKNARNYAINRVQL